MPRQVEIAATADRVQVVAGLLVDDTYRILITDRRHAASLQDYWEFPGGKLRDAESATQALARELDEELGIEVLEQSFLHRLEHDYDDLRVAIDFFRVTRWQGVPRGREGQGLRWVFPEELDSAPLLPADQPIIQLLINKPPGRANRPQV